MKKTGQVAKNAKKGPVEQLNQSKPAPKGKVGKAKAGGKNKIDAKPLTPAKKIKVEEEHDEVDEEDEDSGADLMDAVKTENDALENETDEDANAAAGGEDSDSDEEDDAKNQQNENSDDDGPTEEPIEKKKQDGPQQKKKALNNPENRDRRIYVRRLHPNTIEAQVKEYFSKCGEIESIDLMKGQRLKKDAVIVFKDAASIPEAVKLHNTILNDATILVEHAESPRPKSDEQRSIIMINSEGLTKLEGSVIVDIFSNCGKIENLNVVCEKNVLAYITFEEPSAVPKALELNDTTQNGIKVEVNLYKSKAKAQKTKVFVKNIANGVSEEDLTKMFQVCGNVVNVSLRRNNATLATAIIEFEDQDGYCKAFLMHEEKLRGRSLFIEPFSLPRKFGPNKGKRPAGQKWKGGPPQKVQKNN